MRCLIIQHKNAVTRPHPKHIKLFSYLRAHMLQTKWWRFSSIESPCAYCQKLYAHYPFLCLQVSTLEADSQRSYRIQPAPVLSNKADGPTSFYALCKQPPLQNTFSNINRPPSTSFKPLHPSEGPTAGQILALDAEFVAFAPALKAYSRYVFQVSYISHRHTYTTDISWHLVQLVAISTCM